MQVRSGIAAVIEVRTPLGRLGSVVAALEEIGASVVSTQIVEQTETNSTYRLELSGLTLGTGDAAAARLEALPGVQPLRVLDPVFAAHQGGKIAVISKVPVESRADLSVIYTPGVAQVCLAIAADLSRGTDLTIKGNTVAVVTDGSAILGLGNLGPLPAMPVMEGKAMLFKRFAGVDAFPICLATQDTEEIIRVTAAIAPGFGGINLEDIAAPRCFEVERRLQAMLDIPVFHDDQHGTAIVTVAALINAAKLTGKRVQDMRAVVNGVGAAGVACARMMLALGVGDIIACDTEGAIYRGRTSRMNAEKQWMAENTNVDNKRGVLADVLHGADLFVGVSAPRTLTPAMLRTMAPNPLIFAMANPTPEILPEDAAGLVGVMATGRSDYPNQINNALAFPGVFRGALNVRASAINEPMKLAAARALADLVSDADLSPEHIIPSI
ncbi:MAG: NAD-dependent malic enzyme, partial [Chloroflexi bacterium]|nr:NAD-dependent malic enzyme [Chloroflexota bacterium]